MKHILIKFSQTGKASTGVKNKQPFNARDKLMLMFECVDMA